VITKKLVSLKINLQHFYEVREFQQLPEVEWN